MKKILTKILTTAMLLSFLMITPSQVFASEYPDSGNVTVDGSFLTNEMESTVIVYPRARGVYLLTGSGTITQTGTGVVGVAASTTATMTVSSLKVAATLQRYVNGTWIDVDSWSNIAYNTYYVSLYKTVSVTRGYYYRVLSNHWAHTEWTQGVTNGIWIA